MKVLFKFGIGAFAGTIDNGTYSMTKNQTGSIMRKYVVPALTTNNSLRGSITKNLATVYKAAQAGYVAQLKTYCQRYNSQYNDPNDPFSPVITAFAMFVQMMYSFADAEPAVDLETVSITDLETIGTDIQSIADSIASGYLKPVTDGNLLTTSMWT